MAPHETRLVPDSRVEIDKQLVEAEWPASHREGIYFNSGSCGVKPISVLAALEEGYRRLNKNPTIMTFVDTEIWDETRKQSREFFGAKSDTLFMTQNSTFGIQLLMQSFLKNSGDEFVTTDQEHSCVKTLSTYLEQSRGVITKRVKVETDRGSANLTDSLLSLVGNKTKLVLLSEINCLSGWRPDLTRLNHELKKQGIPLLVDGAHSPGQGPLDISQYPLWVASGHKWMGGPNGTGFLFVDPIYMDQVQPLLVGDRFIDPHRQETDVHRYEWPGTCDPVRWLGLQAAIQLQKRLTPAAIANRQAELRNYLRAGFTENLPGCQFLTPESAGESSGIIAVRWSQQQLKTSDLRQTLWKDYKIWVQPDFGSQTPGLGMRLSCHPFISESNIDALISALVQITN